MLERWSLAFVHTRVAVPTVFQAAVEAWSREMDQNREVLSGARSVTKASRSSERSKPRR